MINADLDDDPELGANVGTFPKKTKKKVKKRRVIETNELPDLDAYGSSKPYGFNPVKPELAELDNMPDLDFNPNQPVHQMVVEQSAREMKKNPSEDQGKRGLSKNSSIYQGNQYEGDMW